MKRYLWVMVLGSLITAGPAPARDWERPRLPSREIQIPSGAELDRMFDQTTVPKPSKDFSSNDVTAIRQMDERARTIDREVMKGICSGC